MNLCLSLVLCVCMAQTPPLADAVDALIAPSAGSKEIGTVVGWFDAATILTEISDRFQTDPHFAPGSDPANRAIKVLASTRNEFGRTSITDPRQVALLAESYKWTSLGTQLTVLQAIPHIEPSLKHHMTESLSTAINSDNLILVETGMIISSRAGVSVEELARTTIRSFALHENPDSPLWHDRSDDSQGYSELHLAAVAAYLNLDDDQAKWEEVSTLGPELRKSAIIGAVMAIVDRANQGRLRAIEKQAFDTFLNLAKDPAAVAVLEPTAYLWLIGHMTQASPDQASLFRGLVRVVAECSECSDAVIQRTTQAINYYMKTAQESQIDEVHQEQEFLYIP